MGYDIKVAQVPGTCRLQAMAMVKPGYKTFSPLMHFSGG
jgi:hypothetical protein